VRVARSGPRCRSSREGSAPCSPPMACAQAREDTEELQSGISRGLYSCDRWNCVRYKVFRQVGIQGDFRILRPSFAMKLKEIGMVLDDRTRLLRHTSTETTAKFYSNMEPLEPSARVEERLTKN